MGKKARVRDNLGRFRKHATVVVLSELEAIAQTTGVNVKKVIADKLEETYKKNVEISYTPRSAKGWQTMMHNEDPKNKRNKKKVTYKHTGTFLENIHSVVDGDLVKIEITKETYNDGKSKSRTTHDVYRYLTEGTNQEIGVNYAYKDGSKVSGGRNYPTEIHDFETWTRLEMKGFLDSLANDINNGDYTTYRYTGKRQPRTYKSTKK